MMFGRGGSRRDRDILRQKVIALAAKGPGGWWRIAKNLTRYGLGVGDEHPATRSSGRRPCGTRTSPRCTSGRSSRKQAW